MSVYEGVSFCGPHTHTRTPPHTTLSRYLSLSQTMSQASLLDYEEQGPRFYTVLRSPLLNLKLGRKFKLGDNAHLIHNIYSPRPRCSQSGPMRRTRQWSFTDPFKRTSYLDLPDHQLRFDPPPPHLLPISSSSPPSSRQTPSWLPLRFFISRLCSTTNIWTQGKTTLSFAGTDHLPLVILSSQVFCQRTVCDGNPNGSEAPPQDHVIRSIITVAAAATGEQDGHRCPTKDHPTHEHTICKKTGYLSLVTCQHKHAPRLEALVLDVDVAGSTPGPGDLWCMSSSCLPTRYLTETLRDRQRDTMTINTLPNGTTVTELGQFLKNPPEGFTVKAVGSAYQVQCGEENLVFIDKFHFGDFDLVFQNSLGRKLKMHNLWEYTSMRKSLLSKRIYVLVSLCDQNMIETSKKRSIKPRVLQEYVLSVNGGNPMMKWQMEKGLDWTISSVAGESYRVEIDLSEILQSLAAEGLIAENLMKYNPTWKDASFTLKYYSDALFDFPHWRPGFDSRSSTTNHTVQLVRTVLPANQHLQEASAVRGKAAGCRCRGQQVRAGGAIIGAGAHGAWRVEVGAVRFEVGPSSSS
ncbi:hypothetical protein CCH79_00002332 [Gambusia affinis]|uniref:Uncharacterized protein n=1 Tax=Gambusia affinis TaxID=33528 RepID=A0A315VTX8_GAMAF|nr:hypothetical protein CCH79_00002332 [Gambusia affinis]